MEWLVNDLMKRYRELAKSPDLGKGDISSLCRIASIIKGFVKVCGLEEEKDLARLFEELTEVKRELRFVKSRLMGERDETRRA